MVTPHLTGTILPGITRASVIQIARDLGHEVYEERVDVDMAMGDEAFCAGTAAVISLSAVSTWRKKLITATEKSGL